MFDRTGRKAVDRALPGGTAAPASTAATAASPSHDAGRRVDADLFEIEPISIVVLRIVSMPLEMFTPVYAVPESLELKSDVVTRLEKCCSHETGHPGRW